ncbi:hypothetical protein PQB35_gp03 [Ochrobactrum phage vB_OspP_OH]|uniref:Uncharacterized protein n=1 Tax=Ochrobactrum phage vB_OspP_OH TaxID=2712957 RepID=A0A6G6XXW2_9CAUD|nr:hypothetical protein PQB35_gp03 [Ochrobactrum phage vB_OspP_OH]QIG66059.1 hypothetical protein phiOH_p03 [Ochrobactrum phage vB_OspP_OH]
MVDAAGLPRLFIVPSFYHDAATLSMWQTVAYLPGFLFLCRTRAGKRFHARGGKLQPNRFASTRSCDNVVNLGHEGATVCHIDNAASAW